MNVRNEFNSLIGGAITIAAVPEPTMGSLALLAGLAGWGGFRWRKAKAFYVAVLLAVLFGVSGIARADTIVSSLNNTPVSVISFSPGSWAASSFQTDNEHWNLSSVTLLLGRGGFSSSTANLRLYSDAGGQPGVSLANLGTLTLSGDSSPSLATFTLAGGLTLDPATTYWIALGNTSPNQGLNVGLLLDDNGPPPFTFTGVPGASMICSATSGGGNGVNPPTEWTAPGPNGALLFAVDGIPVPEPGEFALMFLGGIGFFLRRSNFKLRPS